MALGGVFGFVLRKGSSGMQTKQVPTHRGRSMPVRERGGLKG